MATLLNIEEQDRDSTQRALLAQAMSSGQSVLGKSIELAANRTAQGDDIRLRQEESLLRAISNERDRSLQREMLKRNATTDIMKHSVDEPHKRVQTDSFAQALQVAREDRNMAREFGVTAPEIEMHKQRMAEGELALNERELASREAAFKSANDDRRYRIEQANEQRRRDEQSKEIIDEGLEAQRLAEVLSADKFGGAPGTEAMSGAIELFNRKALEAANQKRWEAEKVIRTDPSMTASQRQAALGGLGESPAQQKNARKELEFSERSEQYEEKQINTAIQNQIRVVAGLVKKIADLEKDGANPAGLKDYLKKEEERLKQLEDARNNRIAGTPASQSGTPGSPTSNSEAVEYGAWGASSLSKSQAPK